MIDNTGAPILVPVGCSILGRVFSIVGGILNNSGFLLKGKCDLAPIQRTRFWFYWTKNTRNSNLVSKYNRLIDHSN